MHATWVLPVAGVLCSLTSAQSYVGGDLSNQAPYGLSTRDFNDATSRSTSHASFPVIGYNTSIPAGDAIGTSGNVTGWALSVNVSSDVSLSSAADDSVDKSKVTEATVLSVTSPAGQGFDNSSWTICAIVFAAGLQPAETETARNATLDGSCGPLLPSDCIRQLQVNSLVSDKCEDIAVPNRCAEYFATGNGSAYQLSSTVISAARFFAKGSAPTSTGNDTAIADAENQVWPVLLVWSHLGGNGDVHDSVSWLSCLRAGSPDSSGDGGGKNIGGTVDVSKLALVAAIGSTLFLVV